MDSIIQLIRDGIKPRVGLDVDNTSVNVSAAMLPGLNRMLGTEYALKDINSSWRWMEKELHLDPVVFWLLYNDAWAHYRTMEPLITRDELGALSVPYSVDFITAKESHTTMPDVFGFISMHFPDHRGAVIEVDLGESKTAFGHRLFVDDAPHLAEAVEGERGKRLYLVRWVPGCLYGYNEQIKGSYKVRPVPDTHEAVRSLLMLARKAEKSERVMITKQKTM